MKLTITINEMLEQNGNTLTFYTDCEEFRRVLDGVSPNLLIDYLNYKYGTQIERIDNPKKKGGVL